MVKENDSFELKKVSVRLVQDTPLLSKTPIDSAKSAVEVLGWELKELDREVIAVVNLKSNGNPINCTIASMGSVNMAVANPRELLKASILSNAASMIMIHNHVSGSLVPSHEDVMVTQKMERICRMIEIPLRDHVIVAPGREDYFSFREHELLKCCDADKEIENKMIKTGAR